MTNKHMTGAAGGARLGEASVRRGGRARGLVACAGLALALAPWGIAGAAGTALAASSDNDELDEYSKQQVVYVKADAQGATNGVYVVNAFDAAEDGSIVDEGRYEGVANLTDSQALKNRRDEVKFDVVEDETFYYQGNLSAATELPWKVTLAYYLDDEQVDPDELSGAEGEFKMVLDVEPNPGAQEGSDARTFSDNYLLQVSTVLDGDKARSIEAPDATVAAVGNDTQLTYMVFPGKSASFVVTADVEDFAFDGWQIVAVPLAMASDVDTDEMVAGNENVANLKDGIAELDDGAAELAGGASELADGAVELDEGASELADAAVELAAGVDALAASGADLKQGSTDVAEALDGARSAALTLADGTSSLVEGAVALASGSQTYRGSLATQAEQARTAAAQVDVNAAQAAYETAFSDYMAAYTQCVLMGWDPATDESVVGAQAVLQEALVGLVGAQAIASGYESAATALEGAGEGYAAIDDGIQAMADAESEAGVYALDAGMGQLASGLATLDSQYGDFDQGVADYTAGVGALQEGMADYVAGADELAAGAADLSTGAAELAAGADELAEGTAKLRRETRDLEVKISDAVREELEAYLNPAFQMVDFVNGSTANIERVQFVIMTDPIEEPDDEDVSEGDGGEAAPEKTFWEKLTALFA